MKQGFTIPSAKETPLNVLVAEYLGNVRSDPCFKGLYKNASAKQKKLEEFLRPGKSPSQPYPTLTVLRKWNSYTPLLPPLREDFLNKGGGYFLRTGNIGVVIDPGFNFIENFLKAGFRIDDVDHVLISHAHNDHTVELEGIFSLLLKRNKKTPGKRTRRKRIKLFINLGAFKKFAGYFDLAGPPKASYIEDIVLLNRHQHYNIDRGIDLFTTEAKHHEMITSNYALGFIVRVACPDGSRRVVRMTCDSGWDTGMEEDNRRFAEPFEMDSIDVLVAHIGSLKKSELAYDAKAGLDSKKNASTLYQNHLGLIGTVASIKFWNPRLVLLSEFGEEMSQVRIALADGLREKMKMPILPTDLNFRVNLQSLEIYCFKTRKYFIPDKIEVFVEKGQLYPIGNPPTGAPERQELQDSLGFSIKAFP